MLIIFSGRDAGSWHRLSDRNTLCAVGCILLSCLAKRFICPIAPGCSCRWGDHSVSLLTDAEAPCVPPYARSLMDSSISGKCKTCYRLRVGTCAPADKVQQEIDGLMLQLEKNGYVARSQVVWGQTDADIPFQWESGANIGFAPDELVSGDNALFSFQVQCC